MKCIESLSSVDRIGYLEKMLKDYFQQELNALSVTLKKQDTELGFTYYRLKVSEQFIPEKERLSLGLKKNDLLPTPQALDWMTPRSVEGIHKLMNGQRKGRTKINALKDVAGYGLYYHSEITNNGGKLNPTFVEYMMGFPEGWTSPESTL